MTTALDTEPPRLPGLTLVRLLAKGGYAEVFLYEQVNTRLRVAVKVLFAQQVTEQARRQFAAEASAMAELADHPYIVQVFSADVTEDGRPYLVMKYYPQRSLAVRAREERLSVPEVLQIGIRISCAVETAHRAGILHRDIKPANILTSQYGEPGLTDFGIATRGTGDDDGEALGLSMPWAPPEVVFARSPGDRTADVYSLGATLWHLLAGRSPFEVSGGDREQNSTAALMRRIREHPVPKTGRDDVPPALERLLAQAMAKRPTDRPQTALELARALQSIETEQRWSPTPLVLLENAGRTADAVHAVEEDGDEPATRRKGARVVAPRPAAPVNERLPTGRAGQSPGSDGEGSARARPRERQGMPAAPEGLLTVRRPAVPTTGAEEPSAPTAATGLRRSWRGIVAVAVVAAAVVGVGVTLAGHKHAAVPSVTKVTAAPPTLVAAVPDSPTVTGRRTDAGHVTFTWSAPDSKPGDLFYWQQPGEPPHEASGTSVTLPATAPAQVCIVVVISRADGTESASSAVTCAG